MDALKPEEQALLETINCWGNNTYTVETVTRRSDRLYDIIVSGTYDYGGPSPNSFTGWLPLMFIQSCTDWTDPYIADRCMYPEMAYEGDWSAIRDTPREIIWEIFEDAVTS